MSTGPVVLGREGNKLTSSMIKDRLKKEVENNVTLTLQPSNDSESINVQGRGELQIGDKTYIVSCLKTYYSQLNNNY